MVHGEEIIKLRVLLFVALTGLFVCLFVCVQGEKGEPGLVIAPDGNLLEGLRGAKVSPGLFGPVVLLDLNK